MATTLNRSFLTEIRNRLNNQGITSDDFHIIQEQKARRINLTIKYLYDDYYYNATIEGEGSRISSQYSPGEVVLTQNKHNMNSNDLLDSIEGWVNALRKEIKNTILGRQAEETEEKLAELENLVREKFKEDKETFFTRKEANELKEKLSQLEKLYNEAINKNVTNKNQSREEYTKLHDEVELLKEQVEYLSKKKWATALMIKIMNWTSRNPAAAKQIGQEAVKALLPKEIEESLPPSLLPPSDEQLKN
ncbi:hypothetical protein JG789_09405 [Bacillus halotolerans]|uniref:hypothetical protein n=1 Tax=Bacillus halotolerans TaxID=260554 RepID=UPI0018F26B12|nr:hypothetical protein [Bacillus halotolerans]MBJ7571420.1 hypothetical protein [Bacillus halotolerans]